MRLMRYAWRLARYRTGLYLASSLLMSLSMYLFPLLPGLVVQQIFDGLTGAAPATRSLWSMIALLIGAGLARMAGMCGAVSMEATLNETIAALLCQNIFAAIFIRAANAGFGESPSPFKRVSLL